MFCWQHTNLGLSRYNSEKNGRIRQQDALKEGGGDVMYDPAHLLALLKDVQSGHLTPEEALNRLRDLPFEDIGYAKVDHHRSIRSGYPEVIYCEGKTAAQVRGIASALLKKGENVIGTRASRDIFEALNDLPGKKVYHEEARIIIIRQKEIAVRPGTIVVASAGTADLPVAEEAAVTAEELGNQVVRIYDVGVAGLHRLLAYREHLYQANVIIAVAGMEGALPSIIAGLVDKPVIAVPTSVGYGTHLGGFTPLLAMLNSCANGIGVVNINNGFGAAYLASSINRQIEKALKSE